MAVALDGANHIPQQDAERDRALARAASICVMWIQNHKLRADPFGVCDAVATCARERIPKLQT